MALQGANLGRMMTMVRPSLSVEGMTNSLPVASSATDFQVISWGLKLLRLIATAKRLNTYAMVKAIVANSRVRGMGLQARDQEN
jgi:hypothetical protein